jgi:hypothetical protein
MCGRVAARSDGVHGPFGRFSGTEGPTVRQNGGVSLHAGPLEQDATLPDGRVVRVRIGVPEDGYVAERKIDTVTAEIYGDGKHLAVVSTILEPEQLDEARAMLRRIVTGLESGELAPTAGAIGPVADTLP